MKNICLIGPPGSGKGSYGKLISKAIGVPLISTSDILKRHGLIFSSFSSEEDSNSSSSSIMSGSGRSAPQQRPRDDSCHSLAGKLIDDSVVCETLLKEFQHLEEKKHIGGGGGSGGRSGYILDGFPRTLQQINIMTTTWPHHLRVDGAIKLAVPDAVCQQKLEGRRLCLKCDGNYNVADVHYYDDNDSDDDGDNGDVEKHQQNEHGDDDGSSGRWWNLPAYLPELAAETVDNSKATALPSPGRKFVCGCDPTVDWMTRHDDEHDVVLHRLKVYHEHMDPILDYFDSSLKEEEEEGSVDFNGNNNTSSQSQSQSRRHSHSRLLKLYPYNGFDDVPQIIETVQSWMDRGWDRENRG